MQREKPHKVICKSCHKPIDYTAYRNLDKLYCPFCGTENHLDQNNQDTDDTCDFDVFLCYNAVDRPAVKEIAKTLQQRKLLPWFDEWALRPGVPWQITIMDQIKRVKSVAVFVGRDNVGPWEDKESRYFLREFVKKGAPIIPVLLKDASEEPQLPNFLMDRKWVDLRESNAIEDLIWGITGRKYKS